MNIKELLSTGEYKFKVYREPVWGKNLLVLQKKVGNTWFDVQPEELMSFKL